MIVAITIVLCLRSVTAFNYFHESSEISLKPQKDQASFGFSLGYQGGTSPSIVTGAPHCDLVGKVFRCPMKNWFNTNKCEDIDIDIDTLAPYERERAPNLKLNLGVSIAATSEYFMTCAPLWPANEQLFTYGTCFTYNGTAHRYRGILEKHIKGNPKKFKTNKSIDGGTGWKTLVDEDNDLLLIAKVVLRGDILSVNASRPLAQVKSLVYSLEAKNYITKFRNVGSSMTAGRFFKGDETVYAISATTTTVLGTILFVKILNLKLALMSSFYKQPVMIEDATIGSMFGAAMASTDLNDDGLSELLVGAPVMGDGERGYENGAIHIYLGGDMKKISDDSRHRVIIGSEDGSRFGTAIASSDIDGDNIPEIFVSAPFAGSGVGAVYVLCGFEVYQTLISFNQFKKISLSQLGLTQKIRSTEFKTFGYSLQSIPDINNNGCDELAVGAPGSNEVVLLRCIPAVKVDIRAELAGGLNVREQDSNFTVTICVSAEHLKGNNATLELKINDEVIGNGASIDNHQRTLSFDVPVSPEPTENCTDVVVHLSDNEPGEYMFSTELQMDEGIIMNSKDFSSSWVVLSPQSVKKASVEVSRHCSGKDCDPDLSMDIMWDGSGNYSLGSSDSLTTRLLVRNSGHSSFDSCVLVRTSGATVVKFGCGNKNEEYKCFLPKPLRRNAEHEILITFNMSQPTNSESELRVQAYLYDVCNQNEASHKKELIIPYHFDDKQVTLKGSSHNQTISDVKIQDQAVDMINDAQEYWVVNDGLVLWKNITASITIDIQPFITSYRVSPRKGCFESNPANSTFNSTVNIICTFDVPPRYSTKFIVSTVISKDILVESLVQKKMEVTSQFKLQMFENSDTKEIRLATVFTWQKERSLGQNQNLIIILAIFGAVIALAVVIFVLYKMEFFKRKGKTKLENLKHEHIRRQSVKRSMSVSNESNERADYANDGLDMQIEDDSPFEIVGMTEPVLKPETK